MQRHDLNIPVHDGSRFTWAHTKGVADASDLGIQHGPVWNDACDVGFFIESHRTGVKKLFTLVIERRDAEGDILYWTYRSDDGLAVLIFNN